MATPNKDPVMYTQAQLDEAIEKAAARGAAMALGEVYPIMGLDPLHKDYREHRRQKRLHLEYLAKTYEGSRKAKTWLFGGIFTGIGTFIVTAIWKGWENFIQFMQFMSSNGGQ